MDMGDATTLQGTIGCYMQMAEMPGDASPMSMPPVSARMAEEGAAAAAASSGVHAAPEPNSGAFCCKPEQLRCPPGER